MTRGLELPRCRHRFEADSGSFFEALADVPLLALEPSDDRSAVG